MGTTTFTSALKADRTVHGGICSIPAMLDDLDDDTRADVEAAFADPKVTHASIARALKAIGVTVGASTINRHRKGNCLCE